MTGQKLAKAIEHAKRTGGALIVAKLDRLSRSVKTLFELRDSGIGLTVCDAPELNTMSLGIFATRAQDERELISQRTRAALQVKRHSV